MNSIVTISADRLSGLGIQLGDVLRVVASQGDELILEIRRELPVEPVGTHSISDWIGTAKGSVKLTADETVDDVRTRYYAEKYGLRG